MLVYQGLKNLLPEYVWAHWLLDEKVVIPLHAWEYRLVEQQLGNWFSSPMIVRLLIGLELTAALLLLLGDRITRVAYILSLPLFFIVFDLGWETVVSEKRILDCPSCVVNSPGITLSVLCCFIALAYALLRFKDNTKLYRKWFFIIAWFVVMPLPFIFNPIYPSDFKDTVANDPVIISNWLKQKITSTQTQDEMLQQNHVLGLFSAGCPHCQTAAKKLAVAREVNPNFPPVKIFFLGDREGVDYFFERSNTSFDHYIVDDVEEFFRMSGNTLPAAVWVKDGAVVKRWSGYQFNYGIMAKDWISEE